MTRALCPARFHQKFPEGFSPVWENVAESAKLGGLEVTEPPFWGLIRANVRRLRVHKSDYVVNEPSKRVLPQRFPNCPKLPSRKSRGILLVLR